MVANLILESGVQLYELYQWTLTFADKRVESWLLMSSPFPTITWTMAYLMMVFIGPSILSPLPTLELRALMFLYNLAMCGLNGYIFVELVRHAYTLGYSLVCQPVNFASSGPEYAIACALWWFYISKFIEFADSAFFILRKKYKQLTMLHIYHHSTMFCFWWIGVKWVAGGSAIYGATLNSFVHIVMYGYYAITAAFPHWNIWWKKYITVLQMVQFFIALYMGSVGLYVNCPFPRWMGYTLICYMLSFIVLFSNFWRHAYTMGSKLTGGTSRSKLHKPLEPQQYDRIQTRSTAKRSDSHLKNLAVKKRRAFDMNGEVE